MVGAFLVFVPAFPYGVLQLTSPGTSVAPLPPPPDEVAHAGPGTSDGGASPLSARAVRERTTGVEVFPMELRHRNNTSERTSFP